MKDDQPGSATNRAVEVVSNEQNVYKLRPIIIKIKIRLCVSYPTAFNMVLSIY